MANILMITQGFPPETNPRAARAEIMANVLAERHAVKIVTLEPGYPDPDVYQSFSSRDFDTRYPFPVNRKASFKPHIEPLWRRGLSEVWMAIRLAFAARSENPDVMIVPTPSMFLGPFCWVLAKIKAARYVWDVQDVTWRYVSESTLPSLHRHVLSAILETWMKVHLQRSDLVIGATQGVTDVLIQDHGVDRNKIITVPVGIDQAFLDLLGGYKDPSQIDTPVVSYVGLFGYNHGISILLDVAKQLSHIQFVLAGDGPEGPRIRERVRTEGIQNVDLVGYLTDKQDIVRIYNASDILVNHTKDTPILNRTVVSAKLYEYMATGKPMVYAGKGVAVDFLNRIGNAITVPPDNPEAIADAIHALLKDPGRMAEMGRLGREYVLEHFLREKIMDEFVLEVEARLLPRRSRTPAVR